MTVTEAFANAFRLWVTNGVPASGENRPNKNEIIAIGPVIDNAIAAIANGPLPYATVAAMEANTTAADGTLAYVFENNGSTSDPANGVYQWDDGENEWVLALWYFSALKAVVQPLVDDAEAAAAAAEAASTDAVTAVSSTVTTGIEVRASRPLIGRRTALLGMLDGAQDSAGNRVWSVNTLGRFISYAFEALDGVRRRSAWLYGLRPVIKAGDVPLMSVDETGAPAFCSVAPLRGGWGEFNTRQLTTGFKLGTVQAPDLYIFEVVQSLTGTSIAALATGLPISMTLFYGQSSAGRAGGAVINANYVYPHHAIMFSEGIAHLADQGGGNILDGYGDPVSPGQLLDFAPLKDTGQSVQGSHVAGLSAVAREAMDRTAKRRSPARLWRTDFYGGQPLDSFVGGTVMYENALTSARQAREAAARYGLSVNLDFLVFIHGESGPFPYALSALMDDLLPDLAASADQDDAPHLILVQINNGDVATPSGVELTQLAFAKAGLATGVSLVPMYDCPLQSDDIHPTPEGRALLGERIAWVQAQVTNGEGFDGVWPVSVVRTGASIVVTFNVAVETDPRVWTLTTANQGFTFSGGATISSVAFTSPTVVTVTLSTAASGTLHYANQQVADADNGWASQRGLVVHRTGAASPWEAMGLVIPDEIVIPAARFSQAV